MGSVFSRISPHTAEFDGVSCPAARTEVEPPQWSSTVAKQGPEWTDIRDFQTADSIRQRRKSLFNDRDIQARDVARRRWSFRLLWRALP